MMSDEQQHCAAALQQLHTHRICGRAGPERNLEKIMRAPQVVDSGGGVSGGVVVVDQRIRWSSMRDTGILTVCNINKTRC